MSSPDGTSVLLAGRSGVYRLLQNIFGNEPNEETLQQLRNAHTSKVLRLFATEAGEYERCLDAFLAEIGFEAQSDAEILYKLEAGFTRLFVGPGKVEADPWESYYISRENALFQGVTLRVRKAYVEQGLLPAGHPSVADDHIGLELDFLSRLAKRASEAYDLGDLCALEKHLSASEEFVRDHPLVWVERFAGAIKDSRHPLFYGEAAALLVAFLKVDLEVIEEIKEFVRAKTAS